MTPSCPCCADQYSMCSSKIKFSTTGHVIIAAISIVIALVVVAIAWGISR